MSLVAALGAAGDRLRNRPTLLAVGVGVSAVVVARGAVGPVSRVLFDAVLPGTLAGRAAAGALAVLAGWVVLGLLLPLYAAVYEPLFAPRRGPVGTLRAAARALRRRYADLAVAHLTVLGLCVVGAALAGAVLFVASTVVSGVRYAVASPPAPPVGPFVDGAAVAALTGAALGFFLGQFADTLVVAGHDPRRAWLASARFVVTHPLSALGYVAVVGALLAPAALVGVAVESLGSSPSGLAFFADRDVFAVGPVLVPAPWVGAAAAAVPGTVALALAAVVHATYTERAVTPVVDDSPAPLRAADGARRVALVALVVLALVSGAAAVRTADLGVGDPAAAPLPDDPAAAYATARANTVDGSFRRVTSRRNGTDGGYAVVELYAVDRRDRQNAALVAGPETAIGSFAGEGVLLTDPGTPTDSADGAAPLREAALNDDGERVRRPLPGYGATVGSTVVGADSDGPPDGAWTAEREGSTLVLRTTDPEAVVAAAPRDSVPLARPENTSDATSDTRFVARVDRERGVLERVRFTIGSRTRGVTFDYRMRYETGVDVRRPPSLGPRTAAEWAWDALYY